MFKKKLSTKGGEITLGRRHVNQLRDRLVKQYCLDPKVCDFILGRRRKKDLRIFSLKFEGKEASRGVLYKQEFEDESNFMLDEHFLQNSVTLESEQIKNSDLEVETFHSSPIENVSSINLSFTQRRSKITKYPAIIPWVFELGAGKLFPTLHLIWIYGSLFKMQEIIVLDDVKSYILNGADLMAGGILFDETDGIKEIEKDQIWGIRCKSDEHPIAIGVSLLSWREIESSELQKGKVLKVIHHCNDMLSMEGNYNFSFQRKETRETNNGNLDMGSVEIENKPLSVVTNTEEGENQHEVVSGESYDIFLEMLLVQVLNDLRNNKSVLPLNSSAIWDGISRLSLKKYGIKLDIKKSSYNKISKFFQHYNKIGVLVTKENKMGDISVVEINTEKMSQLEKINSESDSYLEFELIRKRKAKMTEKVELNTYNNVTALGGSSSMKGMGESNGLMEVINIYQPNTNFQVIIDYYMLNNKDDNFGMVYTVKTSRGEKEQFFISLLDAKKAMEYYVNSNDLRVSDSNSNSDKLTHIRLDKTLESLISKKDAIDIPVSQVFKDISNFLKPFHYIKSNSSGNNSNEKPNVIKGNCKPILIYTESRAGAKKFVTVITPYISFFGLDPHKVAESCQKKFACSSTVSSIKGFPSGANIGVIIQGKVATQTSEFLTSRWGVPKSYIEIR